MASVDAGRRPPVYVPKQKLSNKRRPISGKKILEHARSLSKLTKKQKESIKRRALLNRKLVKKPRFPRMYNVQNPKRKLQLRKVQCFKDHRRRIRKSITPGTVLILLAGRHRGKRVVFLKPLASGMLLVTGPFKYNGVPLRRVNQRYVIATKTKIKLNNIKIPPQLGDEFFRRQDLKTKKTVDKIFAEEEKKYAVSDDRKKFQKQVDTALIAAIKRGKNPSIMASYLKSMFSLSKKDYPHKMVF
ncbi:60S ribosomal protein L6 [Echinococcus granulosus]|uniref:Large ribosomal subunit protein eL6 n=1 Tax=Echinococcus granulosus TaxID=6210 RepID=U6J9P3_ECHGR|nr:60S ribosomal protein L6 [Echinococcus granulosus]EUB62649.1 60S ribosomal protein L6 [Echinococcus granulosus]KAH9280074.1 60S ribosomal protein L6 [Echinococcus granulosus]CDS19173.1 60s ribosomal protein l6 [Echinococcus granulosus]